MMSAMKKYIVSVLLLLAGAFAAFAVPAYPGKISLRTESGSSIQVTLHGDEFCHWAMDAQGREVTISREGIARPVPSTRGGSPKYKPAWQRVYSPDVSPITRGDNRFLVILVEFADQAFVLDNPKDRFTRLLNENGYSDNGGTGSVRDYYSEQSSHVFNPTFDVVGPVKISGRMADYGGNDEQTKSDKNPTGAFLAAVEIVHSQRLVNFADYDCDGDGYVDNIFFYYAGYNEAEGAGDDTIWPHAYGFYYDNSRTYDGVTLGRYACTSELRGKSGANMCGIGTFCHEFGHVLGLPDFYDTDYEENGSAASVYSFSLMCNGNYNNNGRTPPNLGAIERNMLGWMDFPEELTTGGSKTIRAITNNEAFRVPSTNPGEFFLLETRDGTGWDRYIDGRPTGLVIYHVDQSGNIINGSTALSRWQRGYQINCVAAHPCYYIVPASTARAYSSYVFPGTSNVTSFGMDTNPSNKDYTNGNSGFNLNNIAYIGGVVTLDLDIIQTLTISGKVTDSAGNPMEGVSISVEDAASSPNPAPLMAMKRVFSKREAQMATAVATYTTGADGKYSINVPAGVQYPLEVSFTKPYYNPASFSLSKVSGRIERNVLLRNVSETEKEDLQKCGPPSGSCIGTKQNPSSWTAGVYYDSDELTDKVGMRIAEIKFLFYAKKVDEVSVFIDFGEERVLSRKVTVPVLNSVTTVDVSDADIRIPADTPLIFGYSFKNADDGQGYPLAIDGLDGVFGGCCVAQGYLYPADGTEWGLIDDYNLIVMASLEGISSPFPALGIKVIDNPGGYKAGDVFNFRFVAKSGEDPVSTVWYLDGRAQSGSSTVLTTGPHEVKALCTYSDGSTEEIVQMISVE